MFRSLIFRRLAQPVPDAADGVDEPVGGAELLADGGDVDVDGAVGDEHVGAHGLVHELVARQHAAAGADEGGQQLELGERELDRLAVDGHLVLGRVDRQRPGLEDAAVASPAPARPAPARRGAARCSAGPAGSSC